jgi:hypothetical protein
MKALTFSKKMSETGLFAHFCSIVDDSFFIFRFCQNKELPAAPAWLQKRARQALFAWSFPVGANHRLQAKQDIPDHPIHLTVSYLL